LGAAAQFGGKHFIARRIVNHSRNPLAPVLDGQRNAKNRKAVGKVRGAIERIDVPLVLNFDVLPEVVHQQAAGFASHSLHGSNQVKSHATPGLSFSAWIQMEKSERSTFSGAASKLHRSFASLRMTDLILMTNQRLRIDN